MHREIRVMTPPLERVDHLPDGTAGLCFLLFDAGKAALLAVGPWTRALYTRPSPFVLAIHVGFPPGGAYPYFGVPLDAIADGIVPVRELWGGLGDRLRDELLELGGGLDAVSMAKRVAAIERALDERLRMARYEPAAAALVRAAVDRLARAHAPIGDLAAELQISDRSLRRAFGAVIGVSPKVYARIARFRRVAARTAGAAGRWAEVARAAGYADQSHLANEFRALAGVAPSMFAQRDAVDRLRVGCPLASRTS
jgi:AraC-like DNA-binding protein